ncbi:MAG: glycosyltransferase family 4 protein [Motiliproteus sp.]
MRICVVGPVPPPAGGMANLTADIVERLRTEGAQVELVAVNAPYRPQWAGHIKGVRALFRLLPYLWHLFRSIRNADVVHLMANSGWSWHLYAAPAIWLAHFLRTPLILNYHGGHAETFFNHSWRWIQPSMHRVNRIIVPSRFLQQLFADYNLDSAVIHNCIDTELFSPPATRTPFSNAPRILISRNLEPIYGIDLAIGALPQILQRFANARLIIAGSGPQLPQLQQQIKQLGIDAHVEFTGRLSRQQIAERYRSCHLLINPSRVDNAPISITEALACGLPVVSSRAGGIPLLVEDGKQALLVEVESSPALAEGVLRLLTDPPLMQQLTQQGLEHAQRFRWQLIRSQLLGSYQHAISQPKALKHPNSEQLTLKNACTPQTQDKQP